MQFEGVLIGVHVVETHELESVSFDHLALLPGKYLMRVHVLDPEGLRLYDTVEREFVVTGETRDYGVVELTHRWLPGRAAPAAKPVAVERT